MTWQYGPESCRSNLCVLASANRTLIAGPQTGNPGNEFPVFWGTCTEIGKWWVTMDLLAWKFRFCLCSQNYIQNFYKGYSWTRTTARWMNFEAEIVAIVAEIWWAGNAVFLSVENTNILHCFVLFRASFSVVLTWCNNFASRLFLHRGKKEQERHSIVFCR